MKNKLQKYFRWLMTHPYKPTKTIYTDETSFDNGRVRNMPCVCGSGKKFKHCCLPNRANKNETDLAKKFTSKDIKYYNKKYKEKTESN